MAEAFHYFHQYLSEGACLLTIRRGRKTIAKAEGGIANTLEGMRMMLTTQEKP